MTKLSCSLTTLILIFLGFNTFPQGGDYPYVGSTHNYYITPENASNTLAWTVLEGSDGTEYDINSAATTSTVNITWNTAGTYTIQFTETNPTTLCTTVKQMTVEVTANTFDVSTSNPTTTCNDADGQANYSGTDATTTISFTVEMTTSDIDFSPDWEIDFNLTSGAGSPTLDNISASEGILTGSGPYNLSGISSTSGNGTVDISLEVTGDIYTLLNVGLELTSAIELTYSTPDVDSDDWSATQTINAIPQTSDISTD